MPKPTPIPFDPYPGLPKKQPTRPSTRGLDRKALTFKEIQVLAKPTIPEGGGDKNTPVKTGTNANFTGLFFSALPNYFIKEALSLRSLTGNEILQVAHRENFYTTAEVLNRNIVDLVESRESYSPAQIIKLQTPDYSYLFENDPATYIVSLASSVVNISIPSPGIDESYKIQVETFTPREIKNDTIYP